MTFDTSTKEGRERRLYQIEKAKADNLMKKWKKTGKVMYAIMLNQLTGEGDLTAGKHFS